MDSSIDLEGTLIYSGSSWQQQLYSSLDNASTIIALLSPDYIVSQVCQEEYNLALMKHIAVVRFASNSVFDFYFQKLRTGFTKIVDHIE